jgi:hypothetical protein
MPIYSADLPPAHPVSFLWALPALPGLAATTLAVAGRALGRRGVALVVAAAGLAVGVAAAAAYGVWFARPDGARLLVDAPAVLLDVGAVTVRAALALDPLRAALALVVALVGAAALVTVAARDGRRAELRAAWLSAGLAAALLVVLADDLALALVGWEVLALTVVAVAVVGAPDADAAVDASRRGAEALVVSRAGQCAGLAGVVLLLWGLGGGAAANAPRTVTVDVRGESGAAIELRTLGDRAPMASVRELRVGATLAPREIETELALRDTSSRRPFAERLEERRVGPIPLLPLACVGLLLGALGLALAAAVAHAGPALSFASRFVTLFAATAVGASCVCLVARLWFLFELVPPVALVALVVVALGLALAVRAAARARPVVAPAARRALRELGILPARDFARAAAWLDRGALAFAGGALALAALVALATIVVRP